MKVEVSIIFSLAFLCIGNSALLGAKECTYGPSYWCSSIVNAKKCNAVNHCIETIWEKTSLPEDNDDVCSVCKDMVKEARDQLLSNVTQDEIRQVFEGSCKLIPIALVRDECIKVVDDFIPELIDTLASQMNPQMVCATAGLCNSVRIDRLLVEYYKTNPQKVVDVKKNAPRDCNDCKSFITDIVNKVKFLPRSQVLNQVLSICGRLGSFSDGCMSLVQTNFEFLYDFLRNGLHPDDFCITFGMCSRFKSDVVFTAPRTEDEPCDFCVAVVKSWRDNFLANTTKEQFKMILDGICEQTGNFRQECHSLVDQYFEMVYELIASEIQPKEICEAVGLCGANALFKTVVPIWTSISIRPQDQLALEPFRPAGAFTGRDEANSYKNNEIHLPRVSLSTSEIDVVSIGKTGFLTNEIKPKIVQKSDKCVMCEFVLHFLQNVLNNPETRDQIKTEVEKLCTLFPHSIAEQCEDYIDAYGDQLIQLLELEIDPATICPLLHLCPAVSMYEAMSGDSTCILCEYAMTELDQIIGDKNNEAAVKKAVESVCKYMPKSIRPECKSFIDMYIDEIVDLIVNDVTPRQICAKIGLCPNSYLNAPIDPKEAQLPISRLFISTQLVGLTLEKVVIPKKTKFMASQSTECVICEYFISKLDASILTNSTEEQIREMVDKVCLLFPNSLSNDCLGFVEEYSSVLIELLVSKMDPVAICRALQLCKDPQIAQGMFKTEVKILTNLNCYLCKEVVSYIDRRLQDGKVFVDLISVVINDICSLMEPETRKKCEDFVIRYNDFLVKLIYELLEPERVCKALKMCSNDDSTQLLGARKCSWGPSYWCQSKLHADSCNAVSHCTETAWMGAVPDY